ncbi:MAG TPA: hypothetical protein VJJ76_00010 [archaeon]|nr:hypothetical protein [archaeon]
MVLSFTRPEKNEFTVSWEIGNCKGVDDTEVLKMIRALPIYVIGSGDIGYNTDLSHRRLIVEAESYIDKGKKNVSVHITPDKPIEVHYKSREEIHALSANSIHSDFNFYEWYFDIRFVPKTEKSEAEILAMKS